MYRTWTVSAADAAELARQLEVYLNEYADQVVSVSYAVEGAHHALVVYRPIDMIVEAEADEAVAVAEQIIDDWQQ